MITNFFIPELNNHDVQELWFQQDGATCHTARATIDILKDTFGDHLISRFGPVNWPPRSCDLTPLDYFLWGYVKSLVYADKPQTLDHLEDNIRRVIADIRPQMLEKVIENWTSRLDYIRASRGSHMPEIIFRMLTRNWMTSFKCLLWTRLLHAHCVFGILFFFCVRIVWSRCTKGYEIDCIWTHDDKSPLRWVTETGATSADEGEDSCLNHVSVRSLLFERRIRVPVDRPRHDTFAG
ncbi:DUF4817 domain-containing protein [Trichonephila clavipes]|nr:DUF4817 domain-containing protein [Trichonephila clavipes]